MAWLTAGCEAGIPKNLPLLSVNVDGRAFHPFRPMKKMVH